MHLLEIERNHAAFKPRHVQQIFDQRLHMIGGPFQGGEVRLDALEVAGTRLAQVVGDARCRRVQGCHRRVLRIEQPQRVAPDAHPALGIDGRDRGRAAGLRARARETDGEERGVVRGRDAPVSWAGLAWGR